MAPHLAFCCRCRLKHRIRAVTPEGLFAGYSDWLEKHPPSRGCRPGMRQPGPHGLVGYGDNADVKIAFQSEQTMTTTNLQSKASSATAGWSSASVDNTANLYRDAIVDIVIAAVNTAPGSDKNIYVFAYGGTNSTDLTPTGAASGGAPGTEGSLTFPSISTLAQVMPLAWVIPYPVQNAPLGATFTVARCFGNGAILPPFWGIAILNFTNFTLASSGNTVKYRGVYDTVV